ncbi:hypothetical protein ACFPYJ_26080 [Paenibacillus solisilvae]|uniref:Uncharacterized protein n=1 Tax=Paenibacillus solisilvae TaxID=2486751 RepID=A0ABW0W857_9BACL
MKDIELLYNGLSIIASSKAQTGDHWEAHFGAAAIAGYFFVRDNDLSGETGAGVTRQATAMVNRYLGGTDAGGNAAGGGTGIGLQEAESLILAELDKTIDGLHWVGHPVIYSAISLLALHELGGWGSEEEAAGIAALIRSFERTIPGRSWIGYSTSEVKRVQLEEEDRIPDIHHPDQLSKFILGELAACQTIYRAEAHHDLLGHMLTYSDALNLLYDLGHGDFFRRGLTPLFKMVKVLRASRSLHPGDDLRVFSPVDRLPLSECKRSVWLPTELEYWSFDYSGIDWDFGHVFKFPFSFYNHLKRDLIAGAGAIEHFRYIILAPDQ